MSLKFDIKQVSLFYIFLFFFGANQCSKLAIQLILLGFAKNIYKCRNSATNHVQRIFAAFIVQSKLPYLFNTLSKCFHLDSRYSSWNVS